MSGWISDKAERVHSNTLPVSSGGLAAAQAIGALCIGGMVVARAIEDRALADQLRDACRSVAFKLGGWDGKARKGSA